jgi:hypothetical protein
VDTDIHLYPFSPDSQPIASDIHLHPFTPHQPLSAWILLRRQAGEKKGADAGTPNLKAVMDAMGHADVKIAMTYQHPELEIVRTAINSRHTYGTPGKPSTSK